MWTRNGIKSDAKLQMKGRYWTYLGISLVPILAEYVIQIPIGIISNIIVTINTFKQLSSGIDFESLMERAIYDLYYGSGSLDNLFSESELGFLNDMIIVPLIVVSLLSIITTLFLSAPVSVGISRWFIRARESRDIRVGSVFSVFGKNGYLNIVWTMFYMNLWLFIWYLLFWIPGIIKTYAYRMVPYLLADNPKIGASRALKLSNAMTRGHKFDIFVLDLSFIGWYMIGMIACCIGIYGVVPYQMATNAELYDKLKTAAVDSGLCTMEELGYVKVNETVENI